MNTIQSSDDEMHIVFLLLLTKENKGQTDGGKYLHLKKDYKMNMRHEEQTKDTSSKIALITEICCSVFSKNDINTMGPK